MMTGASELFLNFTSGARVPHGCFDDLGILREVQRVRLVLDVLVATVEHRVVERGRELGDAAAYVGRVALTDDLTADDGAVLEIPLRLGALADHFVD